LPVTTRVSNWFHNAYYGTLTTCQKDALIKSEQAGLTKAGMGSTVAGCASKTATGDVTGVLKSACADPSQSSFWKSAGFKTLEKDALIVGAILIVLIIILAFVNSYARR
jgi:hypothetical protein